jgi:hypothetical protein
VWKVTKLKHLAAAPPAAGVRRSEAKRFRRSTTNTAMEFARCGKMRFSSDVVFRP